MYKMLLKHLSVYIIAYLLFLCLLNGYRVYGESARSVDGFNGEPDFLNDDTDIRSPNVLNKIFLKNRVKRNANVKGYPYSNYISKNSHREKLPNFSDGGGENVVLLTLLKIVDHKFDTLSQRLSAMERAVNGLQYYNVKQFRFMKTHNNEVSRNMKKFRSKLMELGVEFTRADLGSIRRNAISTNHLLASFTKNSETLFNLVSQKVDKIEENSENHFSLLRKTISNTTCRCKADSQEMIKTDEYQYLKEHKNSDLKAISDSPMNVKQTSQLKMPYYKDGERFLQKHERSKLINSIDNGNNHTVFRALSDNIRRNYSNDTNKLFVGLLKVPYNASEYFLRTFPTNYSVISDMKMNQSASYPADPLISNYNNFPYSKIDTLENGIDKILTAVRPLTTLATKITRCITDRSIYQKWTKDILSVFNNGVGNVGEIDNSIKSIFKKIEAVMGLVLSTDKKHNELRSHITLLEHHQINVMTKIKYIDKKVDNLFTSIKYQKYTGNQISQDLSDIKSFTREIKNANNKNFSSIRGILKERFGKDTRILDDIKYSLNKILAEKTNSTRLINVITDLTEISTESIRNSVMDLQSTSALMNRNVKFNKVAPQTRWEQTLLYKFSNASQITLTLVEAISRNTGWIPYMLDMLETLKKSHNKTSRNTQILLDILSKNANLYRHEVKSRSRRHHDKNGGFSSIPMKQFKAVQTSCNSTALNQKNMYESLILDDVRKLLPSIARLLVQSGLVLSLTNGSKPNEGRVEILHDGVWGSLCDITLGEGDANAVCRYLGYLGGVPASRGYFGIGSGPIWHIQSSCLKRPRQDTRRCLRNGFEFNSCSITQAFAVHCEHQIRLTGYRVEVYHNNSWGNICGQGWSFNEARVVCRQLRLKNGVPVADINLSEASGPTWLTSVKCIGTEPRLDKCHHSGWSLQSCSNGKLAGVSCNN